MLSLDYLDKLKALADSRGLAVHLDGARMFNAATALNVPVARITACVTTVQFCLSKVGICKVSGCSCCHGLCRHVIAGVLQITARKHGGSWSGAFASCCTTQTCSNLRPRA